MFLCLSKNREYNLSGFIFMPLCGDQAPKSGIMFGFWFVKAFWLCVLSYYVPSSGTTK